jgi:hypothetical protein
MFKHVLTILYLKLRQNKTLISILFFYLVTTNFLSKDKILKMATGEDIGLRYQLMYLSECRWATYCLTLKVVG